ncbi:hypothetical protein A9W98_31625 [Mycobacterium gordonae]|uniref:Uncharacterized protein n=1 Tax=Mycobacterium gordonae TaxID=1778 RepID=A0A1A6BA47_MYCGO|nr:hypothetical protein A9W98_31625 [Mycobacterium gordonae]
MTIADTISGASTVMRQASAADRSGGLAGETDTKLFLLAQTSGWTNGPIRRDRALLDMPNQQNDLRRKGHASDHWARDPFAERTDTSDGC